MKAKMPFPLLAALLSLRQRTVLNVNTASLGIRKVSFPSHPPTPHLQYKCISTLISSHLNSLILNVNTASLGKKKNGNVSLQFLCHLHHELAGEI